MPSCGGALGGHDDRGGGSVGGLRRVAGGDGALGVEDRLELGEGFERGVGAGAFVLAEGFGGGLRLLDLSTLGTVDVVRNFDGDDLVVEVAGGDGGERLLVDSEANWSWASRVMP
jgi:hypothetical protein